MIVDTHTHLYQNVDQALGDGGDQLEVGESGYEAAMEPVDVAFVLGFESEYLGVSLSNEEIANFVNGKEKRVVGFAGIDPMKKGNWGRIDDVREAGLRGVVISPPNQNYHPTDTRAMRLYEMCAGEGIPVMVDMGTYGAALSRMEYARPWLLDEVAGEFPELRILVLHCGEPWFDETLMLIGKHENVYAELGCISTRPWQLYGLLVKANEMGVTDHILFGSDFPRNTPQEAIEAVYSLVQLTHGTGLPSVPREKLRGIVERDAMKALGV